MILRGHVKEGKNNYLIHVLYNVQTVCECVDDFLG